MNDSAFLQWLANRLVNVYKESENTDFVLATNRIANKLREQEAQPAMSMTCPRSNRSYCAMFETSPSRPSKEWYAQKITETDGLDSVLPMGGAAQPAAQEATVQKKEDKES